MAGCGCSSQMLIEGKVSVCSHSTRLSKLPYTADSKRTSLLSWCRSTKPSSTQLLAGNSI